jgi:hypothetical protein
MSFMDWLIGYLSVEFDTTKEKNGHSNKVGKRGFLYSYYKERVMQFCNSQMKSLVLKL